MAFGFASAPLATLVQAAALRGGATTTTAAAATTTITTASPDLRVAKIGQLHSRSRIVATADLGTRR